MANIPNEDIQARNGYLFADMENTPASEKEKPEYALKQIKAVFSQYANNKGDISSPLVTSVFRLAQLRAYSALKMRL